MTYRVSVEAIKQTKLDLTDLNVLLIDGQDPVRLDLELTVRQSFPRAHIERLTPLEKEYWNTLAWQTFDLVLINQFAFDDETILPPITSLRQTHKQFPLVVVLARSEPSKRQAFLMGADIQVSVSKPATELAARLHIALELVRVLRKYPLRVQGWQLREVLHNSENSVVFLAENIQGQRAAIKRFKFDISRVEEDVLRNFLTNANILALAEHPGLAQVQTAGVFNNAVFMVMDYIEGTTLRTVLAEKPRPTLDRLLAWFYQITETLSIMHELGMLHLDLKSSNIMINAASQPVLLDFGMEARLLIDSGFLNENEVYCTPFYVSPERIVGEDASVQSDLYALGVLLYEMLVGEKPYTGPSLASILQKHMFDPIPTLPAQFATCQELLNRLMAKAPEWRLESAQAVLQKLQSCLEDLSISQLAVAQSADTA